MSSKTKKVVHYMSNKINSLKGRGMMSVLAESLHNQGEPALEDYSYVTPLDDVLVLQYPITLKNGWSLVSVRLTSKDIVVVEMIPSYKDTADEKQYFFIVEEDSFVELDSDEMIF